MRIVFASHHCCVRVVKEGLALMSLGHEVVFLQHTIGNASFAPYLPNIRMYTDLEHFGNIVKGLDPNYIDLIHCHNEPDALIIAAKENTQIPVIYDAHDLVTVNKPMFTNLHPNEQRAVLLCDGMVVPSRAYKNYIEQRYFFAKPIDVIVSMCNEWMLDLIKKKPKLARINGIVFEGGVARIKQNGKLVGGEWNKLRDYRPLVKELNELGIPMHFYVSNPSCAPHYHAVGAEITNFLFFNEMLHKITRYDWGFCGTYYPHQQWDWAMPNKLFEYICAGIPVIVMNAAECAEFVQDLEIGIAVKDVQEIKDRYSEHEHFRENVLKVRENLLMERHIGELEKLYMRVLGKPDYGSDYTDSDRGLRIGLAGGC